MSKKVLITGGAVEYTGSFGYTGGTSITSGSLKVSVEDKLPRNGVITIGAGTTLDIDASQRIFSVANSGTVDIASGATLTQISGSDSSGNLIFKILKISKLKHIIKFKYLVLKNIKSALNFTKDKA